MTARPAPTVLIVEDDLRTRRTLDETLFQAGYKVVSAANGRDALVHLAKSNTVPQIILVDWAMPVMDGPTFFHIIQGDPSLKKTPVVMMSKDAAHQENLAGLLRKPIQSPELLELVGRLAGFNKLSS